jgi:hypothetical protein
VLAFFNQNDSNDDEGTGLALEFVIGNLRAEGITEKDVAEFFGAIGVVKQDKKTKMPKIWL